MQTLIKPTKVGFMKRELQIEWERSTEARFLIVSGILFFDTRDPEKLLSEQAFWPTATEAFGEGVLFDFGMPKPRGEVLVAGEAVAPGGLPVQLLPVRFSVGPIRGDFRVFGDRYWHYGENGLAASLPEFFTRMPLTPDLAFGGPGYPKNPQGKGYGAEAVLESTGRAPLPNIERMLPPIALISDAPEPALLGPLAADDPERLKCAGTHDRHWLEDVFPALPSDYDIHAHMMAPGEFRHSGFFGGDETVFYQGFTEEPGSFLSALPRYAVRTFAHYRDPEKGFAEIKMRIDTIMLFASLHKAAVVFRGFVPYALDPVDEISHIMLACDELEGSARDFEYYHSVFACRSDPEEGYKYLLADGQLVPARAMRAPSPNILDPEEEFRDRLSLLLEENVMPEPEPLVNFAGSSKDTLPLPALQLPSRADVADGNIDLAAVIDQMTALQNETLAELDRVIDTIGDRVPAQSVKLARLKAQTGGAIAAAAEPGEGAVPDIAAELNAALDEALEAQTDNVTESRPEFTLLIDEALAALEVTGDEGPLSAPLKEAVGAETAEAIARADSRIAPGEAELSSLFSGFNEDAAPAPAPPIVPSENEPAADFPSEAVDTGESAPPDLDAILAMIEPAAREERDAESLEQTFEHGAQQLSDAIGTARRVSPEAAFPEKPLHEETRKALGQHLLTKIAELPFGTDTAPFANADFAGASIASAALESVDLTDIFLEKTTLEDSAVTAVRFRNTVLCEARWRTCDIAHSSFHGTNLSGAEIEASAFSDCRFDDLTVIGATLKNAHFTSCAFSNIALVECDLRTVRFDQCSFKDCQFVACEMPEVVLSGCTADDVMVVECGLAHASMDKLTADKLVLVNSMLSKARISHATLSRFMIAGDKPADGMTFQDVAGKACGFNAALMRDSALFRCRFEESSFVGCDLQGCDARLSSFTKSMLVKAKLEKADLFAANLFGTAMRGADLRQASLRGANLFECDMTDAKLAGCDLTRANLGQTLFEFGRGLS